MFNFDYITKKGIKKHNLNWPKAPDHPCRTLIVGMLIYIADNIADMLSNKKLDPAVTEIFIRGRKLNILLVFITQSCSLFQKMLDLIQRTISL